LEFSIVEHTFLKTFSHLRHRRREGTEEEEEEEEEE
jgi:hypothetical protein